MLELPPEGLVGGWGRRRKADNGRRKAEGTPQTPPQTPLLLPGYQRSMFKVMAGLPALDVQDHVATARRRQRRYSATTTMAA